MNFKTKYMARSYLLNTLGWAFSFTMFIIIYAWIKENKFQEFGYMMYPNANFRKLADLEIVTSDFNHYIHTLYYWLPVALGVDIGIRKLVKNFAK